MNLSDRLRAAEQQRRGLAPTDDDSSLDLTGEGAAVIDLTTRRRQSPARSGAGSPGAPGAGDSLEPYRFSPPDDGPVWAAGAEGISYNPVRDGDATAAFGDPTPFLADRTSSTPCPRCGGATQVDLFDQVHRTTSLSCLTCFHMFRVDS